MKKIVYLTLTLFVVFGFTRQGIYNYNEEVTLTGVVNEIEYDMPEGGTYLTYILKLDQGINVNANESWEAKSGVAEIQLNIQNHKVMRFKNKTISVKGELFGAINEHHIREVCIKVEEIDSQ